MYIEPNESSDPEKLKFKFQVLQFQSKLLSLELIFENPAYVSTMADKDVLVITLNDFRDLDGNLIVDDFVLKKELPNQMSKEEAEAIWTASITTETILGVGFSFSLIVNLLVGESMNKLLGSIKNFQTLVHLTLMKVVMPANSQLFMSVIFEFVAFDLFDTTPLTATYYTSTDA